MNTTTIQSYINQLWDQSITPTLVDFIKIPNKSPMFDHDWKSHGFMHQAVDLIKNWCLSHAPKNMHLEVIELENRTPVIYIDIPGQSDETLLLYGHLDKQPEMEGWDADKGPWQPVMQDGKLYGRGGADDGYAAFASLAAINALQQQNIPHARCVLLIEASEESGSLDLPFYIDHLQAKIGSPTLVICLDSGCGNYEQLWSTTSLRGIAGGVLSVEILSEGLHSGGYSGIVPSSFRITRELLDRVENPKTGEILLPELVADIPKQRIEQAKKAANILGDDIFKSIPFVRGAYPVSDDLCQLLLNSTWRATLSTIGAGKLPALEDAGNVLRPKTQLKLSFRIPPSTDAHTANAAIKKTLEDNPPYGAKVSYTGEDVASGWHAPIVAPWLEQASNKASNTFFEKDNAYIGEGGTIPFMGMLGEKFPNTQFLITGVLGPKSNAHGPNEFLHIDYAKKLTACVAMVIAEHFVR